jgi:stress responsive alpha/beta barrel protein
MKNLLYVLFLVLITSNFLACGAEDNSAEIEALKQKLADAEKQNEQKMEVPKPGLIHSVFFWLKEDLTDDQKAKFKAGVKSLGTISHIQTFYMGPAADTEERGVVDNTYDMALINQFAKPEDQMAYQIDPIHLKFVDECKDLWTKVVVYDNLVE